MKTILAFDPGDSTGWAYRDSNGKHTGGTITARKGDKAELLAQVSLHIKLMKPDVIVWESFGLYAGKAKQLAGNSFLPCEVIGAIRLTAHNLDIETKEQAPSIKKYAGDCSQLWKEVKYSSFSFTEHTKDALQHIRYYEINSTPR